MSTLRTKKGHIIFVSLILVFVVILSTEARATLYGFGAITANSTIDPGIGEAQLSVDVTEVGTNQVLFTFSNSGPEASSITDIYFDDGTLLGIANIDDSDPGVSFAQFATPGNLPSGNTAIPPFVTTANFSADSDPAAQPNGVNPGETVGILFDLQPGKTFTDVLADLNVGFNPDTYYTGSGIYDGWTSTSLRIGIHVQGFADGQSESFIATPVPGAVLLGMLGLGVAGVKLRKFA